MEKERTRQKELDLELRRMDTIQSKHTSSILSHSPPIERASHVKDDDSLGNVLNAVAMVLNTNPGFIVPPIIDF